MLSHNLWAKSNNINYYEIDLIYPDIINGKTYIEEAILLRNKEWLNENNLHKVGDTMVLSIPEFGVVNAKAAIIKLVKTVFNPTIANSNSKMVTGKFIHYSNDVIAYQLKNLKTGYLQTIKTTPNHSFYVKNRTAYNKYLQQYSHFIAIQNITSKDVLVNENGDEVRLLCKNTNSCGKEIVAEKQRPIKVYNLEIYNKHQYLVTTGKNKFKADNAVLVHNIYPEDKDCGITCGGVNIEEKTATNTVTTNLESGSNIEDNRNLKRKATERAEEGGSSSKQIQLDTTALALSPEKNLRCLVIGCGRYQEYYVREENQSLEMIHNHEPYETMDINPNINPTYIFDITGGEAGDIPLPENIGDFDRIFLENMNGEVLADEGTANNVEDLLKTQGVGYIVGFSEENIDYFREIFNTTMVDTPDAKLTILKELKMPEAEITTILQANENILRFTRR